MEQTKSRLTRSQSTKSFIGRASSLARMINLRNTLRSINLRGPRRGISIHDADSFRQLIRRERYRADRAGHRFALIAIRFLHSSEQSARDEADVIHWLQQELRITDDVGELDHGRIGVLLPDTDREGAEVVADRIRLECMTVELPNEIEISVYPELGQHTAPPLDPQRQPETVNQSMSLMQSLFVERTPLWKRSLDVLGASIAILATSPLLLGIAVAIKVTSPGPVFFAQARSGLGGRPYRIWKFRTMCQDAAEKHHMLLALNEQDGPAFKMRDDPRVTTLGRFLRKTSLDELPQLWNVLAGEMSLVGPRPLPCQETEACEPWQQYRLDVTPGITCIWQVHGRSRVSFGDWMRMDLQYIRSRSPLRDARLLCKTLPAVLSGRGAV